MRWCCLGLLLLVWGCAEGGGGDETGARDLGRSGDGSTMVDQGPDEVDMGPSCTGGECCATAADCNDGVGCTRDECDPTSGACSNTPVDADCPAGTMCIAGMGCRLDLSCEFDTDCPEPPVENNQLTSCNEAMCQVECIEGFVDYDRDETNGCECDSTGGDTPDLAFEDTNCDGIDGDEALAIFVDGASGMDVNPGTRTMPKRTIQAGIDAAAAAGFDVYVSEGTYEETLELATGVGIYGGYQATMDWARSMDAVVDISGSSTAVTGTSVSGVTLQLLSIRSENASVPGGSSIAVLLASSSGMTLEALTLEAGAGASGMGGSGGSDGGRGYNGATGRQGCEDSGGLCSSCSQPRGGIGGGSDCGRTGGKGGDAGRAESGGQTGGSGAGGTAGGPGGASRGDGIVGGTGAAGSNGSDGSAGASFGTLSATGYAPADGGDGANGGHGNGGGGGGGGGGGTSNCDSYGSSGGGGGGGGCGGTSATGGTGGGASIAVLLWETDAAITDTELSTGPGGNGGMGARGGNGGPGGTGGPGGPYGGSSEQDDGGDGAPGGPGGTGGRGGHGGGGGGGPTVGIACGGGATLTTNARNTFSLGAAGDGGSSPAQSGLRGAQVNRQGC